MSERRSDSLRLILLVMVTACLLDLAVLCLSGFFREGVGVFANIHAFAGDIMPPLVVAGAGIWLVMSIREFRGRPFRAIPRLVFLLLLCLLCLSNSFTGYLGPSQIDPLVDPENYLRFRVIHQAAEPVAIGAMLMFWLLRLAAPRRAQLGEQAAEHEVL